MTAEAAPRRFVIYAGQRSGSTWLRQLLDSHPQVQVKGELFLHRTNAYIRQALADPAAKPTHWAVHWARMTSPWRRLARPWHVARYLDRMFQPDAEDVQAVGFKLMYDQSCLYPEVLGYLARHRVRVVHLVRENHLDVLLSQETRRARGVAHSDEPVEQVRIELDPAALIGRLKRRERAVCWAERWVRILRLPHVRVGYEEVLADTARLAGVLSFLGVGDDDRQLHSRTRRLNTAPHWETIANYGAVRDVLAHTRFARFLQTPDR